MLDRPQTQGMKMGSERIGTHNSLLYVGRGAETYRGTIENYAFHRVPNRSVGRGWRALVLQREALAWFADGWSFC
jgi:hypothetical protein